MKATLILAAMAAGCTATPALPASPAETYATCYQAVRPGLGTPLPEWLDAMKPFSDRGIGAVLTSKPSAEDLIVAADLANREVEKRTAAKAAERGIGFANTEGVYRYEPGRVPLAPMECLARVIMQPGALTALERRYSLIAEAAREDRHTDAMVLLAGPIAAPSVDAARIADLARQIIQAAGK